MRISITSREPASHQVEAIDVLGEHAHMAHRASGGRWRSGQHWVGHPGS